MVHSKNKGSRFEYEIRDEIRKIEPGAQRQVMSGAVFGLEGDLRTRLPFTFELKHQEKIRLYEFWGQAVEQNTLPNSPVLILKSNNKKPLAIMDFQDWLELVQYALRAGYPD